ncbi:MAG: lamin tail domain-containing protein [Phycisphaerales bacterium]|nr:lamin tail domain-containing protein [Phycisphaerales bacterium]
MRRGRRIFAALLLFPGTMGTGVCVHSIGGEVLHPVVTEILYAVPTQGGDANLDGKRCPTGDEFVELYNPHDRALQLRGYALTDRHPPGDRQWRFVFPDFELGPREVVVVFNGYDTEWTGPVGDHRRAPAGRHELFSEAWVFTSGNTSRYRALANAADRLTLWDPSGRAIRSVRWGALEGEDPAPPEAVEEVQTPRRGSVERDPATGRFVSHTDLPGNEEGVLFSPGRFPFAW